MNEKDFYQKLADFFTMDQIRKLDALALEMAVDVEISPDDLDLAHYLGRWHMCECLGYWSREEIENAAGKMTDEDWEAFCEQLNDEW